MACSVDRYLQARVWLNPGGGETLGLYALDRHDRQLMDGRMFPLTLDGLDAAMRELMR